MMSLTIRMQADDFFNAYRVLRESEDAMAKKLQELQGKPLSEPNAFGTYPVGDSIIVCLAFAVELYLKDLHFIVNDDIPRGRNGHNILELFRGLPEDIQKEIKNNLLMQKVINFYSMQRLSLYTPTDKKGKPVNDIFEQQIYKISDSFENWRYSYEGLLPEKDTDKKMRNGHVLRYDVGFALDFIEAVKSVADKKRSKVSG